MTYHLFFWPKPLFSSVEHWCVANSHLYANLTIAYCITRLYIYICVYIVWWGQKQTIPHFTRNRLFTVPSPDVVLLVAFTPPKKKSKTLSSAHHSSCLKPNIKNQNIELHQIDVSWDGYLYINTYIYIYIYKWTYRCAMMSRHFLLFLVVFLAMARPPWDPRPFPSRLQRAQWSASKPWSFENRWTKYGLTIGELMVQYMSI